MLTTVDPIVVLCREDHGCQADSTARATAQRFEVLYGERLVRMVRFGSQARGDALPGADIDVSVVLQGPVEPEEEIAPTGELTAAF